MSSTAAPCVGLPDWLTWSWSPPQSMSLARLGPEARRVELGLAEDLVRRARGADLEFAGAVPDGVDASLDRDDLGTSRERRAVPPSRPRLGLRSSCKDVECLAYGLWCRVWPVARDRRRVGDLVRSWCPIGHLDTPSRRRLGDHALHPILAQHHHVSCLAGRGDRYSLRLLGDRVGLMDDIQNTAWCTAEHDDQLL